MSTIRNAMPGGSSVISPSVTMRVRIVSAIAEIGCVHRDRGAGGVVRD
jgi:hypothetical protein